MRKKKLFLLMLAFVATMAVQAQNEFSTLVIETKAGTTLELSLQKKPQVDVSNQEFIIRCGNEVTSYVHEAVRKFYFKPYDPTSIKLPVAEGIIRVVMLDQSKVVICGVSESAKVQLYTLHGQNVTAETSTSGNVLTISLDALTPGAYILNIDNKQSIKLLKR